MSESIAFAMHNISVDQFAILGEHLPNDCQIKTEIQIGIDKTNRGVAIRLRVIYQDSNGNAILVIQITCMFSVEENDWKTLIDGENKISLPHGFLAHLAMHTFGTLRGILYCKTSETPLGAIILPPTNIDELIPQKFVV